jgi:hypothetical protein
MKQFGFQVQDASEQRIIDAFAAVLPPLDGVGPWNKAMVGTWLKNQARQVVVQAYVLEQQAKVILPDLEEEL